MSKLAQRIGELEEAEADRAQAALCDFAKWLERERSEDDRRAYRRWIATPFAPGGALEGKAGEWFDIAEWSGPEALAQWIADNSGYIEAEDSPRLKAIGASMPADLRRRLAEAWRYGGADPACLDWLEEGKLCAN